MNKISIFVTLFLLITFASAPKSFAQNLDLGFKAGINASTNSVDNKTGLTLGLFGDIKTPIPKIDVRAELIYNQYVTDIEIGSAPIEADYFQLPVLIKYNAINLGAVKGNIFAGGYYGFLTRAFVNDATFGPLGAEGEVEEKEFGYIGGIGFEFLLLRLEARYNSSLTPLLIRFDEGEKNQSISVTLGVKL